MPGSIYKSAMSRPIFGILTVGRLGNVYFRASDGVKVPTSDSMVVEEETTEFTKSELRISAHERSPPLSL